jgi:poly(3-hydroxybutyrate) depolymerase
MRSSIRKTNTFTRFFLTAVLLLPFHSIMASPPDGVKIIDSHHYSNVFGETRNYRIFLPAGYSDKGTKRFPVIYFFHGWSQRYFGSSNPYGDFDKGNENDGDNIANFVSGHDVIVVKADGYNRSPNEKYYVRPYNVLPVETYRQFPLYFPELVEHIDSHYLTIADRGHRGISGLSMGGFMTFWIGGKYPHLLSAAGNFCGSPEFEAGPKDFPVEYRHLDMYKNYGGMNVRLHYGDKDFIRGYHDDLNKVWPQLIDNYDFKMFHAAHSTCGMGEMFSFILKTFENPPAKPSKWDHIDVYPEFSVWDYRVMTDRTVPGFTIIEDVDARGFSTAIREFLPDGELLSFAQLSVKTAPVYEKNQPYTVNDLDTRTSKFTQQTLMSDDEGRLLLHLDGSAHVVGINKKGDKANLSAVSAELQGSRWAVHGKNVNVAIKVVNNGLSSAKNVSGTLTSTRPTAQIIRAEASFGDVGINEIKPGAASFTFRVTADSVAIEKFKLTLRDDQKNEWVDYFEIPVRKNVSEIKDFRIADGKEMIVTKSGTETDTVQLGSGNGDGIANPGESIVIVVKDQDKWWRTDLTYSDAQLNPFGTNIRKSDNWSSFDHVGGSAKYDVPLISSTCPENYPLEFFAEYWLPEYPFHIIKQGIVKIQVKGKDTTPPAIGWVQVTGDNVLHVKIYEGGQGAQLKATLTEEKEKDARKPIEVKLNDDGQSGDRTQKDHVFSVKVPQQVFGIFRVTIEAVDAAGNKSVFEPRENFVLH